MWGLQCRFPRFPAVCRAPARFMRRAASQPQPPRARRPARFRNQMPEMTTIATMAGRPRLPSERQRRLRLRRFTRRTPNRLRAPKQKRPAVITTVGVPPFRRPSPFLERDTVTSPIARPKAGRHRPNRAAAGGAIALPPGPVTPTYRRSPDDRSRTRRPRRSFPGCACSRGPWRGRCSEMRATSGAR